MPFEVDFGFTIVSPFPSKMQCVVRGAFSAEGPPERPVHFQDERTHCVEAGLEHRLSASPAPRALDPIPSSLSRTFLSYFLLS